MPAVGASDRGTNPCPAQLPECDRAFNALDRTLVERDAEVAGLRASLDAMPDRVVARLQESLGRQVQRNAADVQTIYGLITGLTDRHTALTAEVAAQRAHGTTLAWVISIAVPTVTAFAVALIQFKSP